MRISDWSSDVCSSDLQIDFRHHEVADLTLLFAVAELVVALDTEARLKRVDGAALRALFLLLFLFRCRELETADRAVRRLRRHRGRAFRALLDALLIQLDRLRSAPVHAHGGSDGQKERTSAG